VWRGEWAWARGRGNGRGVDECASRRVSRGGVVLAQPTAVLLLLVLMPIKLIRSFSVPAANYVFFGKAFGGLSFSQVAQVLSVLVLAMNGVNAIHYRDRVQHEKMAHAVVSGCTIEVARANLWRCERDAWMAAFTLTVLIVINRLYAMEREFHRALTQGPDDDDDDSKAGKSWWYLFGKPPTPVKRD
jgi:hypothetical protein